MLRMLVIHMQKEIFKTLTEEEYLKLKSLPDVEDI